MKTRKKRDQEHEFTLVLTGISDLTQEVEDALYEAGCKDALLSIRCGRPFLTFARNAPSLKDALLTAIRDVKIANAGVDVLRVDICNLVTQAEIAKRIDRSRQLVRQYITGERGPGMFPPPACNISDDKDSLLWYWCEVAAWLHENDMITEEELDDAVAISLINDVLELNRQSTTDIDLMREVVKSIGSHNEAISDAYKPQSKIETLPSRS